jgi:hypothetical protein
MVYIVTLPSGELAQNLQKFRRELRLTKALPRDAQGLWPPIVLVLSEDADDGHGRRSRRLAWMGVVDRYNIVGAVEKSITVDPFRECFDEVYVDKKDGLLAQLPGEASAAFIASISLERVGILGNTVWADIYGVIKRRYPNLADLVDWLLAQASPPVFDDRNAADRSWQEQRDALGCLLRIADFPRAAAGAWRRPESEDDPFLAGLIPQPLEPSLIDHDVRRSAQAFGLSTDWAFDEAIRSDIHVLWDAEGRRLEIVNVNATPVEARLGTDMIYYHAGTESFVLVQYKRLNAEKRSMYVDRRLLSQLDRLDEVWKLNVSPAKPSEWRLGGDPCFLKLAYWPQNASENPVVGLSPGMYLPVSYVRLLLEDDCTLGSRRDGQARLLGYDHVERYLVNDQFIELVKHGLVGTIGVNVEQLRSMVLGRAEEGYSVVVATESSPESARDRQTRNRQRGAKPRKYSHVVT